MSLQSTRDFLSEEFPPQTWCVPDLLTEGVSLVGGRPKAGKTNLLIALAYAKAAGGEFLGRQLEAGGVVFAALEGSRSRLQERVRAHLNGRPSPDDLYWAWESLRLGSGLEEQVDELVGRHPGTRLVIVDTLVRVLPTRPAARRSQYEADAELLGKMTEVARLHPGLTILFATHTRETTADHVLDSMFGSRGITATIETGWVLDADPANLREADAVLTAHGRDLTDEHRLALRWDGPTMSWSLIGDAAELAGGETRAQIIEAIRDAGKPMTAAEIARELAQVPATIRKTLCRMVEAEQLVRVKAGGGYALPEMVKDWRSSPF